jgi:hypothetical protein
MKSDLIDISVFLHHETQGAVLVSDDGKLQKAKWIPKSQCEIERQPGGTVILTLPEWLAVEKELV